MACRVTAFSLYLCLLERLMPSDLSKLQKDEDCKLPKLVGENIIPGPEDGDFFSATNPFSGSASFDVVISNPPWRELKGGEGELAVHWAKNAKMRMPHRQIAAAFSAKAVEAARPEGRIVLILPSSLITARSNADFLRQITVRATLERMINLADFRRLLFAKAEHACTVMHLTNRPGLREGAVEGNFEYWTPKLDVSFAFNRLTLHEYDRLDVSRASLVKGNDELRRRFWGSSRDDSLFGRLSEFQTLGSTIVENNWLIAKGYHMRDGTKTVPHAPLAELGFLPTLH